MLLWVFVRGVGDMGTGFPTKLHFGNYEVVGDLGSGSFGRVYLGRHIHVGYEAAIKVLQAPLDQPGEGEEFLREAQHIAALQHSNIVRLLDFGLQPATALRAPASPYLVMEYEPNGTFKRAFDGRPPQDPVTLLPYVKQLASALQYAHDEGLLHRDVKPVNILLGRYYQAMLSDFGIAVSKRRTQRDQPLGFTGSVDYAAPEQFSDRVYEASDQYALATCLYQWLTGHLPFGTGNLTQIRERKQGHLPPPLRNWAPTLSPRIEAVILTALATDPQKRYASVSDFALAYEDACRAQPAPPGGTTKPGPEAPVRRPSDPLLPAQPRTTAILPSGASGMSSSLPPAQPGNTAAQPGVLLGRPSSLSSAQPGGAVSGMSLVPPPPPPPPGGQPARKPRRAGMLLIIIGLVLALAVGGAGAFALSLNGHHTTTRQNIATPTSTATSSPDFKRYTNKDGTFAISYPPTWKVGPPTVAEGTGVDIDGPGDLAFTVSNLGANQSSPDSVASNFCLGFGAFAGGTHSTVTINGHRWSREQCASVVKPLTSIVEAIVYKENIYFIAYTSDNATFDTDRKQFFTAMEQSFTFLV
jgi:serine/threonine protein kinase